MREMGFLWIKSRGSKSDVSYKRLSSLNTIRVVKLKPGTDKYPIRVKLKTININTARYTALSYTWEIDERSSSHEGSEYIQSSAEASHTIICNRTVVAVNKNLWDALKQLKDLNSEVPIFIDRLCINFDNREERAAQTSMMGHIYAKASAVIVWLGKKTPHSNDTVLTMRKLVNALDWRKLSSDFRCDFRDPTAYQSLGIDRITFQQWRHVLSFCDLKWFTRLWAFHELVNAKEATFLYGDCWMDYEFVLDFAMVLRLTGWLDGASDLGRNSYYGRNAERSTTSIATSASSTSNNRNSRRLSEIQYQSRESIHHPHPQQREGVTPTTSTEESTNLTAMLTPIATLRSIPAWHPHHLEHDRHMKSTYNLHTETERAWKFLELLLQTCEPLECADPRDRILAPLSYVRRVFHGLPVNKNWPIVDHGISAETMYKHFAALVLKHTGQPSVLATASALWAPPPVPPHGISSNTVSGGGTRSKTPRIPLD